MTFFKQEQKSFLKNFNYYKKKKDNLDSFNYCSLIANTAGAEYFKARYISFIYIFNFIRAYIKEILSLGFIENIKIVNSKKEKFKNTIITWGFKSDFKNFFHDKYFNIQSNKKKKLQWIILYMSQILPNKIPKNIILIHLKKKKRFNLFFLFKNLLLIFKYSNKDITIFLKNLTSQFLLSTSLENIFKKHIKIQFVKNIIMPYEGQLFQKRLISLFKKNNEKTKIIGYDHTAPQPIPINLFYDNNSPDKLLLTSKNKYIFHRKYLNWPKDKLKINSSFRFKIDPDNFKGKIFLPYVIENLSIYEEKLYRLLKHLRLKDLSKFEIKSHPAKLNSYNNNKLLKRIRLIKISSKKKIHALNNRITIFLGQTTAIPLALENGLICYNICLDEKFGIYNSEFWKGLKFKEIEQNIYEYKLSKKNTFIKIKKKFNKFENIKLN